MDELILLENTLTSNQLLLFDLNNKKIKFNNNNKNNLNINDKIVFKCTLSKKNKINEGEIEEEKKINLNNWSVEDVSDWLIKIVKLPQYCNNFKQNQINGEILSELTREEIKNELNVSIFGHVIKIYKEIKKLSGD